MSAPNPAVDCYYVVEINVPGEPPLPIGSFLKVTGLTSEIEAVEHKVVRTNTTGDLDLEQIPGRAIYTDIVLSRAVKRAILTPTLAVNSSNVFYAELSSNCWLSVWRTSK